MNALTRNSKISVGDSVLIIGPGPIGLLALQIARLSGARNVTAVGTERSMKRLELALKLGADRILTDKELNDGISGGSYSDSFDVGVITTGTPSLI